MGNKTVIPFGPQHPVLPEPIHLDLVMEDETVIEAIPSIGFVHRGLEKLVEKKDFLEYVYVAERICGICSFMHGAAYCMAVEDVMSLQVPDRARFLRALWSELSRIHSHVMWMGFFSDALGFESLFMDCWRLRERILDLFDMTTGGRVIFSVCKIGGVRKDIPADMQKKMLDVLDGFTEPLQRVTRVLARDSAVQSRLVGRGALTAQEAFELGAVGPMARASGLKQDMRTLGYGAYPHLSFEPVVETAGDSHARVLVRIREVEQSMALIRQCIQLMPQGGLDIPVKGAPDGESFIRVEQPRGEALYYVRGNGTKFLERFRVRTPTFANVPALVHTLKGCELADVPVLLLTIDPCISCTER